MDVYAYLKYDRLTNTITTSKGDNFTQQQPPFASPFASPPYSSPFASLSYYSSFASPPTMDDEEEPLPFASPFASPPFASPPTMDDEEEPSPFASPFASPPFASSSSSLPMMDDEEEPSPFAPWPMTDDELSSFASPFASLPFSSPFASPLMMDDEEPPMSFTKQKLEIGRTTSPPVVPPLIPPPPQRPTAQINNFINKLLPEPPAEIISTEVNNTSFHPIDLQTNIIQFPELLPPPPLIPSPPLLEGNSNFLIQVINLWKGTNPNKLALLLLSMILHEKFSRNEIVRHYNYHYIGPPHNYFNILTDEIFQNLVKITTPLPANIHLVLFIDNAENGNFTTIYRILRTLRIPINQVTILVTNKKVDAVIGRTMVMNYVFNTFKHRNFTLSFSDDDDLHCNLNKLLEIVGRISTSHVSILPMTGPIGDNAKALNYFGDRKQDLSGSHSICRLLIPRNVFINYPMTLDIYPKQMEDTRFVLRLFNMNLLQYLELTQEEEEEEFIKYYYCTSGGTYTKTPVNQVAIARFQTINDFRIYFTRQRMKGEDTNPSLLKEYIQKDLSKTLMNIIDEIRYRNPGGPSREIDTQLKNLSYKNICASLAAMQLTPNEEEEEDPPSSLPAMQLTPNDEEEDPPSSLPTMQLTPDEVDEEEEEEEKEYESLSLPINRRVRLNYLPLDDDKDEEKSPLVIDNRSINRHVRLSQELQLNLNDANTFIKHPDPMYGVLPLFVYRRIRNIKEPSPRVFDLSYDYETGVPEGGTDTLLRRRIIDFPNSTVTPEQFINIKYKENLNATINYLTERFNNSYESVLNDMPKDWRLVYKIEIHFLIEVGLYRVLLPDIDKETIIKYLEDLNYFVDYYVLLYLAPNADDERRKPIFDNVLKHGCRLFDGITNIPPQTPVKGQSITPMFRFVFINKSPPIVENPNESIFVTRLRNYPVESKFKDIFFQQLDVPTINSVKWLSATPGEQEIIVHPDSLVNFSVIKFGEDTVARTEDWTVFAMNIYRENSDILNLIAGVDRMNEVNNTRERVNPLNKMYGGKSKTIITFIINVLLVTIVILIVVAAVLLVKPLMKPLVKNNGETNGEKQ